MGQAHDQPTAQQLGRELDGQNAEEAERQQGDQFTIRMGNPLVNGPLQMQGRCDQRELQQHRQGEDDQQILVERTGAAPQMPDPQSRWRRLQLESGGRPQFQGDAGEMPGDFPIGQLAQPQGRVVNADLAWSGLHQHHEVVEVPVQDGGCLELGQMVHLQAQSPGLETFRSRHCRQVVERGAAGAEQAAAAHVGQVQMAAVEGGNHGHAHQAALAGLGLHHHRHFAAPTEIKHSQTLKGSG